MKAHKLTIDELRLRHAQLTVMAERLRMRQAVAVPTRPGASALGREIRLMQKRADDYAHIITLLEQT